MNHIEKLIDKYEKEIEKSKTRVFKPKGKKMTNAEMANDAVQFLFRVFITDLKNLNSIMEK